MAAPSILTYLGLVGPFACGLVALAVSRDPCWLVVALSPAMVQGLRGLIDERMGITRSRRDSEARKE